jgi:hypothetical protein
MVIALSHSDPVRHKAAPASRSIYNVGRAPKRVKIGAWAPAIREFCRRRPAVNLAH